jgi:hypothetical protein
MIAYKFRPSDHVYAGMVEVADSPIIPPHHTRTPPPVQEGFHAVMRRGWVLVEGQAPNEPPPPQPDFAAAIRAERDKLIAASDWLSIRASDTGVALPQEWADYRQALRDITQQEGFPRSVEWPVSPDDSEQAPL